jgi:hypothetical protein
LPVPESPDPTPPSTSHSNTGNASSLNPTLRSLPVSADALSHRAPEVACPLSARSLGIHSSTGGTGEHCIPPQFSREELPRLPGALEKNHTIKSYDEKGWHSDVRQLGWRPD